MVPPPTLPQLRAAVDRARPALERAFENPRFEPEPQKPNRHPYDKVHSLERQVQALQNELEQVKKERDEFRRAAKRESKRSSLVPSTEQIRSLKEALSKSEDERSYL